MQISYLSASRANVWLDCPFRYFLQYHISMPELHQSTIHTEKGTAVHAVLEDYANGNKDYTERLRNYYEKSKLWTLDNRSEARGFPHPQPKNCHGCRWATMNGNLMYHCGIAKRNINEFDGCPKPNFDDDLELTESILNRPGSPLSGKIIGAEVPFEETIGEFKVKGFIDLISEIDEDTLEVRDYKTGSFAKDTDDAFKDLQMRVYSVIAKRLYPKYSYVVMTLDYLRKQPVTVIFDQKDDEKTIKFLGEIYSRIVSDEDPIQRKSFKCRWCIGFEECSKIKASYTENGKFKMPPPVKPVERREAIE
jgi:hypothetical protein